MSDFGRKAKKGILRRLSLFTLRPDSVDRQTSWPFVPRTPSSSSFDQWRYEQPVDIINPMAIRRNFGRRATLGSIWRSNSETDEETIHDIYRQHEQEENKGKQLLESRISKSKNSWISSTNSKTDVNENSYYINAIFRSEEVNINDRFLSAFGTKGSSVGEFQDAKDITCLSSGELLITDLINDRLQICSNSEPFARIFSPHAIRQPWATAVTRDDNIAVTLCKERCVKIFDTDGQFIDKFGQQYFVCPTGIDVGNRGNYIVCDSVTDKVAMFDREGLFIRFLGKSFIQEECFNTPRYVCVSVSGEIIVSDCGHHKVKIFDPDGNFIRSFGSFGKGNEQFKCPYGISSSKYGDIFVSDHYNSRISMFSREGVFIRHVVTSEHGLVHPQALTISQDLHMYVTHGHLKANEILVYKFTDILDHEFFNLTSYV